MSDFPTWWARYPHKVGKFAAIKAYTKALKQATPDQLQAGLERYITDKPEYAAWCHPATWLNQGRWMDEITPMRNVDTFTQKPDQYGHFPPCQNMQDCTRKALAEARAKA